MASKPTKKSVPSAGKIAAVVIKRMALSDLKPHPRNEQIRRHPEPGTPRWETLKKSLDNDYFDPIVFNTRNGYIVSGHLRLKILMAEGYTHADVSLVDYDEQTHLARLIAANRDIGEDIDAGIADMLLELDTGEMDMALTGFDTSSIEELMTAFPPEDDSPYTRLIKAPIYEPQADKPPALSELVDTAKADALIDEINSSSLPDELREFLTLAARRHDVFDFAAVAEYYAHSAPDVQDLFEKSALVLIDFHKAIEYGFVKMTKEMAKHYAADVKGE